MEEGESMAFDQDLFAKIIKETRKSKMTLSAFSEKLNKSERTASRIESGENLTKLPTFIEICNILEVTPNDLLNGYMEVENHRETSLDELLKMLCQMETDEIKLVLELVKTLHKYK